MANKIAWDEAGKKYYETGVDRGVLYLVDTDGDYPKGVAWNGLTTVTESPSGADSTPLYADNIKYLNLTAAEEFGATIEAYTYPDEFGACDGSEEPTPGVSFGQQGRTQFGLVYRTNVGNDLEGSDFGYKLHLIYGAKAAPSQRAYATINDSPSAITFSWAITTTPVTAEGYKPTSAITIDSTKVDAAKLAALETILYGVKAETTPQVVTAVEGRLPLPAEIITLMTPSGG